MAENKSINNIRANKVIKILMQYESYLSDGYKYYMSCETDDEVPEQLRDVALDILDELDGIVHECSNCYYNGKTDNACEYCSNYNSWARNEKE